MVGFLATAILVVNNVRDLETDRRAGKNTSAVRLGRANAINMYKVLVIGAFVLLPFTIWAGECKWWPLIGLLAIPLAIKPIRVLETRTDGPALNKCLAATGGLLARLQPAGHDRPAPLGVKTRSSPTRFRSRSRT